MSKSTLVIPTQSICDCEDDIVQFKVFLIEIRQCFIADSRSEDIACYGSCRIAVASMIYRSNHRLFEVVEISCDTI